ncbi:MAG: GC-type dockerin domain-anchored protein [Phycisphaerales bacterium]
MRHTTILCVCLFVTAPAVAQPTLYGIRAGGELVRIDHIVGGGHEVAMTGILPGTAVGRRVWLWGQIQGGGYRDHMLVPGVGGLADRLTILDMWTVNVFSTLTIDSMPAGYTIAGMGSHGEDPYVLLTADDPGAADWVGRFALSSPRMTLIGSTGRSDMQAMTSDSSGILFAIGGDDGGALYHIDQSTGQALLIGGQGTFGDDTRALAIMPDGTILAAGAGLRVVDRATGVATLIGPTGFDDIRGLAVATACYLDCALGGAPPTLNVNDFICFMNTFAMGLPYANCDGSNTPPVLNVSDFICFMNKWAEGCT